MSRQVPKINAQPPCGGKKPEMAKRVNVTKSTGRLTWHLYKRRRGAQPIRFGESTGRVGNPLISNLENYWEFYRSGPWARSTVRTFPTN